MSLVSNVSVLKAEWFQKLNEGFWQVLAELAATSTGTFYQVKGKDGLSLIVLVTDLTSQLFVIAQTSTMKIERLGRTGVFISAGNIQGTVNVALSPVLPDVIANYRIFTGNDDVSNSLVGAASTLLTSTSNLRITMKRLGATIGLAAPGSTDANTANVYPSDTQVDVGLGHTHATDSLLSTTHTHPHTGTHQHSFVGGAGATINVDWMIVHV